MKRRSFFKSVAGLVPAAVTADRLTYSSFAPVGDVDTRPPGTTGKDFPTLARELASEKRPVVGVFHDAAYAGREVPASLRPEHFQKSWGARDGVRVVLLDKDEVRSYSLLFKGRMDILVYPYGPLYPMDGYWLFSGDTLTHFLARGGAVLTTGGVPFGLPVSDEGKPPAVKDPVAADGLSLNKEIYERWVAPLGYKYYVHPHPPAKTRVDRRFLPGAPDILEVAPCRLGIFANNSSHEPVPKYSPGNVFPGRYPARQVIPLLWGADKYGKVLAVNGLFVQDFHNGSRCPTIASGARDPLEV